ncbi:MAG TPA: hypothetical protein PLD88_12785, partial [Candidatus Berkiella sp.]|nr:hypothetical protein [Candidatus Berkiella sp.]
LQVTEPVTTGLAFLYFNMGLGIGDLSSSLLSQWLQSRRHAVMIFLASSFICVTTFLTLNEPSSALFYFFCTALGISSG